VLRPPQEPADSSTDSDFVRDRALERPVYHHFRAGKCAIIMSSTPSSRRQTTWCFLCIESAGIVGNFSARQQPFGFG
jgi:hypothetical protein